jgi:putative membrane protein
MTLIEKVLVGFIAFEHIYILIIEMFLWTKPKGIKAFGLKSKEFAEETKVLGANQGLYNGFLAAGLILTIIKNDEPWALFFVGCVLVASLYGAYSTKSIRIFYIQGIPAIIALTALIFLT